jgi:predicted AlkP superfamily pyrophosphatase or phosphodiesterase
LAGLDIKALRKAKNIILLVIDGLGYEYLQKHGADTMLIEHLHGKITSVFPSTTATGITTIVTGTAPQQHAITGWFMFIKELGLVARILPFNPRYGGPALGQTMIDPHSIFDQSPLSARLEDEIYYLIPSNLFGSDYTMATSTGAERLSYSSLEDCLGKIKDTVHTGGEKKYIYAYWAELDSLCHEYGTESQEALTHLRELDYSIALFLHALKGSRSMVLITSDHGLIDTGPADRVNLKDHPALVETLTLPLCGEPRVAYCYVHPVRVSKFREYVKRKLRDHCTLYDSRDLIRRNFYGLYKQHEKLQDRIGDYVLIMKKNFVIKDFVLGEAEHFLNANHGGVSAQEMYVPLITVSC